MKAATLRWKAGKLLRSHGSGQCRWRSSILIASTSLGIPFCFKQNLSWAFWSPTRETSCKADTPCFVVLLGILASPTPSQARARAPHVLLGCSGWTAHVLGPASQDTLWASTPGERSDPDAFLPGLASLLPEVTGGSTTLSDSQAVSESDSVGWFLLVRKAGNLFWAVSHATPYRLQTLAACSSENSSNSEKL